MNRWSCSPLTLEARFWAKVDKSGDCWVWTGSRVHRGYGSIGLGHGFVRTHRLSWELHNGPIPDGLFVLHTCDNPPCVNPDHLWLGTNSDNMRDAVAKGRVRPPVNHQSGEDASNARLTAAAVRLIRDSADANTTIARRFGVTEGAVRQARLRITWKGVA